MANGRPSSPPPTVALRGHDILYILSRHRWVIIILSLTGLVAGAGVYLLRKPAYVSEAQLLVKYIVENRALQTDDSTAAVRTMGGDNVLNSEMGIISSMDLAKEVAQAVGASNIVDVADPLMDPVSQAAVAIRKSLEIGAVPKSNILNVRFQHRDPMIARSVLTNLVAAYQRMHTRIHRSPDFLNDLQKEADQRRISLDQVGEQLRQIKTELKVASVEDAKQANQEETARTRKEISVAETLLAEKQASLAALTGGRVPPVPLGTNTAPSSMVSTSAIPTDRLVEYRNLRIRIDELGRREQTLLLEYTDLSPFVQAVRQRLSTNEAALARLVAEYPGLASSAAVVPRGGDSSSTSPTGLSPAVEIPAIEARLKSLNSQLEQLHADALKLDEREAELEVLTRRKQIEEKRYVQLATALGQAGIDQAITSGRTANISIIQQATPPALAQSKVLKTSGGLAVGGIALALAWAFAWELFLDQSVRRRMQIETALRLPVFLSVPRLRLKRPAKAGKALPPAAVGPGSGDLRVCGAASESSAGEVGRSRPALAPVVETDSALESYVEALRDRLIMHFEAEGLERKPKLVGLTSCGHGSGVTTLATALASSLSETGDGSVLYVDMNPHRGPSLHPFQRGQSKVALSQAFEGESRAAAQVQDNLYVVGMTEPGARRVGIVPKTLAALMPKMKASDYDYIIFDFPPVTQTSVTAKVAGLLDMNFLVLESERTQIDLAKNALALLGEGRAKVSAVLNKHRRYIPRRFDTDP